MLHLLGYVDEPETRNISDDDSHQTQETDAASNVNCDVHQLEHLQRKSLGTHRSLNDSKYGEMGAVNSGEVSEDPSDVAAISPPVS